MMKFRKLVIAIVLSLALVVPSSAFGAEMDMMETEMKDTDMKDMDMKDSEMKDTDMMDMSDAYKGVNMMIKGGMEYIELRQLANNLGYVIEWNAMTREITLTTSVKDDKMLDMMSKHVIKLKVGVMSMMINDKKHDTTFKPMIVKGRTYVTKIFADMYIVQMMK